MLPKIAKGFESYSNDNLLALAQNVVAQITTNAHLFDETILKMKDELAVITNHFAKLAYAAKSRATIDIDARNEYRPKVTQKLNAIADYLNLNFREKPQAMDGSGFKIITALKSRNITPITSVDITQSKTNGYLDIKMVGGDNFRSGKIFYTKTDDPNIENWEVQEFTKKNTSIGKFEIGDVITLKLTAIGKDNQTVQSQIYKRGIAQ